MLYSSTRCFFLLGVLGLVAIVQVHAQNLEDIVKEFEALNPNIVNTLTQNQTCAVHTEALWKTLNALRNEAQKQAKITGSGTFSFNSNETDKVKRYELRTGASISRGSYPSEIDFRTNIGVTLQNGEFQENVSELGISYDYNYAPGLESFVFSERYSDNFLSIDQRYEVGGGVILQQWGTPLTENGEGERKRLLALDLSDSTRANPDNYPWFQCLVQTQETLRGARLDAEQTEALWKKTKANLDALQQLQTDAGHALQEQYAKLRLGILVGVVAELEKATVSETVTYDSVSVTLDATGMPLPTSTSLERAFKESLPGTQVFRFEVRPTFVYRFSDRLRIQSRPYFKFAILPRSKDKVTIQANSFTFTDERRDFRLDWQSRLTVDLTDRRLHRGTVSAHLTYRVIYDKAPPRIFVLPPGFVASSGNRPPLLIAEGLRHSVALSFSVRW